MADGTTFAPVATPAVQPAQAMIDAALDAGQTVPGTRRDGAGQYTFDMAETNLWVARQTVGAELPELDTLSDDEVTTLYYRALAIRHGDPLYDKAGDVIDAVVEERARRTMALVRRAAA